MTPQPLPANQTIQLGMMAKPLIEQLPHLDPQAAAHLDEDARAISRLAIRRIITQTQKNKLFRKLMKRIDAEHIRSRRNGPKP